MIRGLGPLTYTLKNMGLYVCVSHITLPVAVATAFEFSSEITSKFEIMCWILSATKNHYLGVSLVSELIYSDSLSPI